MKVFSLKTTNFLSVELYLRNMSLRFSNLYGLITHSQNSISIILSLLVIFCMWIVICNIQQNYSYAQSWVRAQKRAGPVLTVWALQHCTTALFFPGPLQSTFYQENHLQLLEMPCYASLDKCLFNKENPGVLVKYYDWIPLMSQLH